MTRIYGWEPEPYYNISEIRSLETMPKTLKDVIGKENSNFIDLRAYVSLFPPQKANGASTVMASVPRSSPVVPVSAWSGSPARATPPRTRSTWDR